MEAHSLSSEHRSWHTYTFCDLLVNFAKDVIFVFTSGVHRFFFLSRIILELI